MASKSENRLEAKDHFTDLTEKQKAVVNALAEHPDEGPKRIAEIASKSLEDGGVSRSYVHPIKQKHGHLVEKQREIKGNKRFEGKEKTTGNPFESLEGDLEETGGWQLIQDRPVKDGTQEASASDESPTEEESEPQTRTESVESEPEPESEPEANGSRQEELPEPEPRSSESERNNLRIELYCPDLVLLNGRIVLSEFRTSVEWRIGANA